MIKTLLFSLSLIGLIISNILLIKECKNKLIPLYTSEKLVSLYTSEKLVSLYTSEKPLPVPLYTSIFDDNIILFQDSLWLKPIMYDNKIVLYDYSYSRNILTIIEKKTTYILNTIFQFSVPSYAKWLNN